MGSEETVTSAPWRLAAVPILWNNDDIPPERPVPYELVLDEIAAAGYQGTELGANYPRDPALLCAELERRRLALAAAYVALEPLDHDPAAEAAQALELARFARAAGSRTLVAAMQYCRERRAIGKGAPPLTPEGWRRLVETLHRIGEGCAQQGMTLAFHNHAGTFVESEEELDELAARTDPALVKLCLDTGHLLVAGGDPVATLRLYGRRIAHLHVKDVNADALAWIRRNDVSFVDALRQGLFCEVGRGVLDLAALVDVMREVGYDGWVVLEQDTCRGVPLAAARESRRAFLEAADRTTSASPTAEPDIERLRGLGRQIRRLVVESVWHAGAGHLGGPLSAADILAVLYFHTLRIDPQRPDWAERDRFVLSKGHSAIALYAALALRGYFPVEELRTFDAIDSRLQGHPDMTVTPGVDMSTGSLGQGISAAVGMALGAKLRGLDFHTWALVGDGESQEGQVWEAAEVAARYGLDNLTVIVDYNRLPQFTWPGPAESARERPPATLAAKFQAFGWRTLEVDGHDVAALARAFQRAKQRDGRPVAVIARTVKGKGVSFMENQYVWHAKPLSEDEARRALAELEGAS